MKLGFIKVILVVWMFAAWSVVTVQAQESGTFVDIRDGQEYNTVKIGKQTWMAQNLNHDAPDSKCYGNSADSCAKYGRLYDWETAMNGANGSNYSPSGVKGVCPEGWHLPSDAEWTRLENSIGGSLSAGTKLKATNGWNNNSNGTDDYKFSALPGGHVESDGSFKYVGSFGGWWSAAENDASTAQGRGIYSGYESMYVENRDKTFMYSCRCVQDDVIPVGVENVAMNISYDAANSVDNGTFYLNGYSDLTPVVTTFVSSEGSVSICSVDKNTQTTYIYEYTKDLEYIKTMTFQNKYKLFGGFTKDDEGNYYVFSAEAVKEEEKERKNMALVKYNSSGAQQAVLVLPADGVKNPFRSNSCRLEISGDQIAVYFTRGMFKSPKDGKNHQASYGFIANRNNLEKIPAKMPYASHSFNQYILPIKDGFMFVDQGDAFPRSFLFSKMQAGSTKNIKSFGFKGGKDIIAHYNCTFAQSGGLAKTSNGYIFCGTYEKNAAFSSKHNDSRNLFVLILDDNLTSCSEPIWITNYKDKEMDNAANPKMTELETGRYLIMWERMSKDGYEETYSAVVDEQGKLTTSIDEIGTVRLNNNDVLRYSKITKKVYWAINIGNRTINTYAFKPAYSTF